MFHLYLRCVFCCCWMKFSTDVCKVSLIYYLVQVYLLVAFLSGWSVYCLKWKTEVSIIALMSTSPFVSVKICSIYLGALMLSAYILLLYFLGALIPLSLYNDFACLLQSFWFKVYFDVRIATPTFFSSHLQSYLSSSLQFGIYVFLRLKLVSCRQQTVVSCFLFFSISLSAFCLMNSIHLE